MNGYSVLRKAELTGESQNDYKIKEKSLCAYYEGDPFQSICELFSDTSKAYSTVTAPLMGTMKIEKDDSLKRWFNNTILPKVYATCYDGIEPWFNANGRIVLEH